MYYDKFNHLFGDTKIHGSRKKFMIEFILSVIKQRSVQFSKIAETLNENATVKSNIRRIELFFQKYVLDEFMFATFWRSLINQDKLVLAIDRTNWKFGKTNYNILMLTANNNNTAIPLFFMLLDKRGNSDQEERISLMEKYITAFGADSIQTIIGDREFIGEKWIQWLKKKIFHLFLG
jgi:hypothetical protein